MEIYSDVDGGDDGDGRAEPEQGPGRKVERGEGRGARTLMQERRLLRSYCTFSGR